MKFNKSPRGEIPLLLLCIGLCLHSCLVTGTSASAIDFVEKEAQQSATRVYKYKYKCTLIPSNSKNDERVINTKSSSFDVDSPKRSSILSKDESLTSYYFPIILMAIVGTGVLASFIYLVYTGIMNGRPRNRPRQMTTTLPVLPSTTTFGGDGDGLFRAPFFNRRLSVTTENNNNHIVLEDSPPSYDQLGFKAVDYNNNLIVNTR